MRFYNADDVYAYLNRFLNFERKLDPVEYRLDRMRTLRELFGRPDEAFACVHVAGSKGKGSTATMLAAVLERSGGPVGLYTSPHLLHFTERIAISGRPVDDGVLLPAAAELAAVMEHRGPEEFPGGEAPTYFELLTMLGFLCFKRAGCRRAVIEVGLGGRLDSTNVITPVASVITPIELEHTEILGSTIAAIAGEKAGIIKPGVPSFTSAIRPDALAVFRERAQVQGSRLRILGEEVAIRDVTVGSEGTSAVLEFADRTLFDAPLPLRTPMIGTVQARNAALAALVARAMGCSMDDIAAGIATARLRARFELVPGDPVVVLDGAHTPESVRAAAADFRTLFPGGGRLLFGCAKDKKPGVMAAELRAAFSDVIVTRPGTFKESDTPAIEAAFRDAGYRVRRVDDTDEAIRAALDDAEAAGLPLLVTGSFYLCAAAAAIVDRRPSP